MKETFFKIRESKIFQYSVLFIIVFNAFTIGLNTYNLGEFSREIIKYLDYLITIFFVIEISTPQQPNSIFETISRSIFPS